MNEPTELTTDKFQFSVRKFLGLIGVIAVCLLPVAYFGWQGVVSSVVLGFAGVFLLTSHRKLAITMVLLLLLGQFFYPAMDGARGSILRTACERNLRELTIAIRDYEARHGHIPPPYTVDENGRPLHSWRVLLLPFLGEQELYQKIDMDKPWDAPVNLPFHDQMPEIYCCPAVKHYSKWRTIGNTTSYVVVVGPRTPWNVDAKINLNEIGQIKGISRTIAIIESEAHRLPWMSPDDPHLDTFIESKKVDTLHTFGLANFSLFDVDVRSVRRGATNSEIEELLEFEKIKERSR